VATTPGHRELVYERWERQLIVLRFRFPKFVVVSLGDEVGPDSLPSQLNAYVYVRMVGIQQNNVTHPCPQCITVILQTIATYPLMVNYTDHELIHNEEATATLSYVEGSDVNCDASTTENCLQNWKLSVKPNFCSLDGPYQMVWTTMCRPNLADPDICDIKPQYRKPSYVVQIETGELCPDIEDLVVNATIELYRDSDRSDGLDLWRYYFLEDTVHATVTVEPMLGHYMNGDASITDVSVTNAFLYRPNSNTAQIIADKTWTSSGNVILLDFPALSSLFTFSSEGDPEPYVLRVEGVANLSDFNPSGRRRLFTAPHDYLVEIQMYVVPFSKTLTDPDQRYNVRTNTEFILDWRITEYFLATNLPIPNSLRRQIEAYFSINNGYDAQNTDFRILEIKLCKDSACTVVWSPNDISQFWPAEFESDAGDGWILNLEIITFAQTVCDNI